MPFNPPREYPELAKMKYEIDSSNKIYDMVRDVFVKLGMDQENTGTEKWSPFSKIIEPGMKVLIKPNFVKHFHPMGNAGVISTITHASVMRPVIDYVLLALDGRGRIAIADVPLDKADFGEIIRISRTKELLDFYKTKLNVDIDLYDLRSYRRKISKKGEYLLEGVKLSGDPEGYVEIDLRDSSEFRELDNKKQNYYTLADFEVDRYNPKSRKHGNTNKYHFRGRHIYKIPKTVLNSDVVISIPKLKTHKKAGVTLNLKNMIGMCEKIYVPHYRPGSPPEGDAYPNEPSTSDILIKHANIRLNYFLRYTNMKAIFKANLIKQVVKPIYNFLFSRNEDWWGDWYGNDTLWRAILDLNRILLYSDKNGKLHNNRQRGYFSIIDGIIGQEGEGPMTGMPKSCRVIIGGADAVACDTVAAYLMGFDPLKINVIKKASLTDYKLGTNNFKHIKIKSNINKIEELNLDFIPSRGYRIIKRDQEKHN